MFRIAITFLITAILLLPVAGAYASTQKLIVKPTPQSAESRRLSSNPVASGAQGMGQGWVNKFCGPEECMKSR